MNKYKVNIEYQEIAFYSYEKEIEAENEQQARTMGLNDLMQNLGHYKTCDIDYEVTRSDARIITGVETYYIIYNCGQCKSYQDCIAPDMDEMSYDELEPAINRARYRAQQAYNKERYNNLFCVCRCDTKILDGTKNNHTTCTPVVNIRSLPQPNEYGYTEEMIGE